MIHPFFTPRSRSFAIGIALVGLLSLSVMACGNQPVSNAVTLKLIMHVNAPTVQAIKDLDAAFHQKYPNISVDVTSAQSNDYPTLQTARLTAKDVDIVETPSFVGATTSYTPGLQKPNWQQQVEAGDFVDLTGQSFLSNFNSAAVQGGYTFNGKSYAVPSGSVSFTGVFYNKAIFQKYNLQVPTTWSQFVALMQTLHSNGVTPMTIGQKDGWPAGLPTQAVLAALYPNLQTFDQGLWTGSIKYTDPTFVQVLQRTQSLWHNAEKGFGGIDYSTITARFAAGKAAMLPDGTWEAPAIQQADPNFQFGYFPLPASDNAGDNNFLAGKYDIGWAIAASSKHQDAALKWLAFYADPANYTKFINAVGFIPAQPNIQTTPFLQSIAQWTNNLRLAPDQVLHSKSDAGKYANIIGVGGQPDPTVYLTPLGTIGDPASLAQQMQTDWNATKS